LKQTLVQKFKKVHNALVATILLYGSEFLTLKNDKNIDISGDEII
jgi:hypothetical protein